MVIRSEVSRYGWFKVFESGAVVPAACRLSPFSMSCTRAGRPWQSAFWLSPLQKQIARSILNLSSVAITPTDLYSKRLSEWREGRCHQNHGHARVLQRGGAGLWVRPLRTKRCCRCVRSRRGGRSSFWHLSFRNRTHHFSVWVSRKYSTLGRACPQCPALWPARP